ncbi:MAG TPA: hypothetical protein VKQ11_12790 [Candidatus Sulfotelmatobacter sp.]|nr:hypothetical protein [Candidatus Sulfotelmatobacter sp.]
MKHSHWTLILCLVGTLCFLVLPPVDTPGTAFNEMDLPGTVSHFALPRLRLAPPATEKIAVAGLILQRAEIDSSVKSLTEPVTKSRHALSLQPLLCTFLI